LFVWLFGYIVVGGCLSSSVYFIVLYCSSLIAFRIGISSLPSIIVGVLSSLYLVMMMMIIMIL